MYRLLYLLPFIVLNISCRMGNSEKTGPSEELKKAINLKYASGFSAYKSNQGIIFLTVYNPWPEASKDLRYALIPKDLEVIPDLDTSLFDAIISVPVDRLVLTSTTHIPALEALGEIQKLVGFPGLNYISSPKTRKQIKNGLVTELGANEQLDTEKTIALNPDLLIGFGVSGIPRSHQTLKLANIPVVYNGDWMEQNPLAKAEWIKFFGLFLGREAEADSVFSEIEMAYEEARKLAAKSTAAPTVMSGALYRDIWYTPGGKSWGAQFIQDAHAQYIWEGTKETGSLSLSLEAVFEKAQYADFWVAPSQFVSYEEMRMTNPHYAQFEAFKNKNVISYAGTTGTTGGMLYFELGPARPDLVLKDLIHYLHPGLLSDYTPVFFKPLQ